MVGKGSSIDIFCKQHYSVYKNTRNVLSNHARESYLISSHDCLRYYLKLYFVVMERLDIKRFNIVFMDM